MKESFLIDPDALNAKTVSAVWHSVISNPAQLVRRWNYKSAIFSSLMRSSIFLVTYLQFADKNNSAQQNLLIALGAAGAQFVYRFLSAGVIGALVQSFRRVEPAWQASIVVMLMIPAFSHLMEFIVQISYAAATGTNQRTDEVILRSVCVSIISTLFNLFAMRRGVLLVGADDDRKSLWEDLRTIPGIVVEFIAFIPTEICKMLFRGRIVSALLAFLGWGLFAEILCWAVFNKAMWTYGGGKSGWFTIWGIDALFLMLFAMIPAAFYLRRKERAQGKI